MLLTAKRSLRGASNTRFASYRLSQVVYVNKLWEINVAIENPRLKMQTQLIKEGAISADTISKDDLVSLCKEMLKESIKLG